MRIVSWMAHRPAEPMARAEREETAGAGEVLLRVAGCGVCHTDLAFFYDGVPTKRGFPLCLGHEVSGRVVEAGAGAESWVGRNVVVPAVIPCGSCEACSSGRDSVCPSQIFLGNDVPGGFGSHVKVPARGLCPVPDLSDARANPCGLDLASLSVVADAVSTPYRAIARSGLEDGDLAVFVGAGGVGGFGVQIAAALGAHVVAIDVDPARLEAISTGGAELTLRADALDARALKAEIRDLARRRGIPSWRQRIFETSGTTAGQETAFSLLGPGGYLGIVGFTPEKVALKLSNLMAFDAVVQGNWGCPPELYPKALELVLSGKVRLSPFVAKRPLESINDTFEALRDRKLTARPVLVPEG
jgi:6-hydroxycyclohex-1-ene-1-carbonyl-CoA dehydrogenase